MDLIPCPFCGRDAEITKHYRYEMWRLIHRCKVMGAMEIDWDENRTRLLETWNTRTEVLEDE